MSGVRLRTWILRARPALLVLSFALLTTVSHPKWSLHLLAWIALVPLLVLIHPIQTWRRAACLGWISGFLAFLGIVGWIYILGPFTGVGLPIGWAVAGFGAAILAAYLALYVALYAILVVVLLPRQGWLYVLGAPALWVFCEWLRGWMLTGFPWGGLGYTQWNNLTTAQLASLGGVPLISLVIAFFNAAIMNAFSRRHNTSRAVREALPALGLVTATVLYGIVALSSQPSPTGSVRVAIVPGNLPQRVRWHRSALTDNLDHYLSVMALAARQTPDLIVLPETSILMPYLTVEDRDRFLDFIQETRIPVLFGSPQVSRKGSLQGGRNAVILLDGDGRSMGEYYKQHLVPFGEYIPFRRFMPKLITDWAVGVADYDPGEESVVLELPIDSLDVRLGVPICFESVFAGITREFVRKGANVLAILTNDGWYEGTSAIPQHTAFAVFRAIEARRAVIRAANRGISCFIEPSGRIASDSIPPDDWDGMIVGSIPLVEGSTPFAVVGDWVSIVAVVATAGIAGWHLRGRRRIAIDARTRSQAH